MAKPVINKGIVAGLPADAAPSAFMAGLKLISVFLIYAVLLGGLVISSYYLYQNMPGSPQQLQFKFQNKSARLQNQTFGNVSQFFPKMKFNHNNISYRIDFTCSDEKKQRAKAAFKDLAAKIPVITFYPVSDTPDIEVSCSRGNKYLADKEHFIAGEGGAKTIIQTEEYNVINDGVILLHTNPPGFKKCEWPNIELHELKGTHLLNTPILKAKINAAEEWCKARKIFFKLISRY